MFVAILVLALVVPLSTFFGISLSMFFTSVSSPSQTTSLTNININKKKTLEMRRNILLNLTPLSANTDCSNSVHLTGKRRIHAHEKNKLHWQNIGIKGELQKKIYIWHEVRNVYSDR